MDLYKSEEQLLVAGCKKNEPWAKRKLYEQYAPAMLGVCVRYTNDLEKAKDVLHEGFIKIFTKVNMYSGEGSFSGWMRRIFVTTALEFLRIDKAWQHVDIDDQEGGEESFENSAIENLSAEDILKCISELPKGSQLVFNMIAIEGYTHAEIARMLNIKEASSRSQFMRARKFLQDRIQKLEIYKNTEIKYE